MEQIKQFRQWDSLTPGHPENFVTPGVEVTTGEQHRAFLVGVEGRRCDLANARIFISTDSTF